MTFILFGNKHYLYFTLFTLLQKSQKAVKLQMIDYQLITKNAVLIEFMV